MKDIFKKLKTHNKEIGKIRLELHKTLAKLINNKSVIFLEEDQPLVFTGDGDMVIDEVIDNNTVTGITENGAKFEFDIADLNTDDILAIVEAVAHAK
jgi:hypothetical protein